MEIEKILKQLHKIEPDQDYVRHSRARLMMAVGQTPKITVRVLLAGMLRSGSAMAAIGLLFFFAIGGSVWNLVISPVTKLAKWDQQSLLAEAQAIDTQIYLTDLQYSDPGYERQRLISPKNLNSISIAPAPEGPKPPASTPKEDPAAPSSTDPAPGDTNATSTSTGGEGDTNATSTPAEPEDTTVDVGEALDILSH